MSDEIKLLTQFNQPTLPYHITYETELGLKSQENIPDLAALLEKLRLIFTGCEPVRLRIYQGVRVHVSAGPVRYLILPGREPIAITTGPADMVPDPRLE